MVTVAGATGGTTRPHAVRSVLLVAAVVVLGVALVAGVVLGGWGASEQRTLPDTLAGLPAQQGGPAADVADDLTARLAAEPSVSGVAVQVYGTQGRVVVVLALTPREPLVGAAADELPSQVLGAAAPRRGGPGDVLSDVTEDGLATVTCSAPEPDAATCVSVEPATALVVLTRGLDEDPVEFTGRIRAELAANVGS